MTNRKKTNIEANMDEELKKLDPASIRYKILNNAKKFKSNWLDLGQILSDLLKSQEFQKWGYNNFEEYCKKELKIKLDTAMKLVASFGYLKKYEPGLMTINELKPVPDFKVINHLVEAEKAPGIEKDTFKELHNNVFDEGISEGKLKKKIISFSSPEPEEQETEDKKMIEKLKRSLSALKSLLPVFEADSSIISSVKSIEDFVNNIEI